MSLRDDILALNDCQVQELHIPEWGKTVHIRALNGLERSRLGIVGGIPEKFMCLLVAMVLCDEEGNRTFEDKDADALSKKNGSALKRILEAGLKLNLMDGEAVDDTEKKSVPVPSGNSGSV